MAQQLKCHETVVWHSVLFTFMEMESDIEMFLFNLNLIAYQVSQRRTKRLPFYVDIIL